MLPYFVAQDFPRRDRRSERGPVTRFELEWFAPHFEFRFPKFGRFRHARHHGRAAAGARTVARAGRGSLRHGHRALRRLVGRAPCRSQSTGMTPNATHQLQWPPSSASADRNDGEFVAGVRYRAWQPPRACIRHSGARSTDLRSVDTWVQRSMGGCQYHVMHPGGRNYERFRSTHTSPKAAGAHASSGWTYPGHHGRADRGAESRIPA